MAKADKSTVVRRTQEVLRLILAGGEFEDIRQYAAAQGWKLSVRQLRRYQEVAHKKLAEAVNRDQRQLLGRHLMQRRALYARAVKVNDTKTALNVLRDEAQLEGLYPSANKGGTLEERFPPPPPIGREERFLRMLSAEAKGDKQELALMEHLTPRYGYPLSDLDIPRMMLHILTLMYVAEQLDHAAMFLMSAWHAQANADPKGTWDLIGGCHAFKFKVEVDAWELFTKELGVEGMQLVRDNHRGTLLELFTDQVYELAPEREVVEAKISVAEGRRVSLATAETVARDWRALLREVLKD